MIAEAEHIVCDDGVATAVGVGFTVTVAVMDGPGQPLAVGVIVKVTTWSTFVVLVSVPMISPEPAAGIPVAVTVLSLVQLKVVPITLPLRTMLVIGSPEQTDCDDGVATAFGVGFTVIVKVLGAPVQVTLFSRNLPNAHGPTPTGIVASTRLVAVLITDTVLEFVLATYNLDPSALTCIPCG